MNCLGKSDKSSMVVPVFVLHIIIGLVGQHIGDGQADVGLVDGQVKDGHGQPRIRKTCLCVARHSV